MKFLIFLFFLFAAIWFAGLVMRAAFTRWLRRRTEEFNRAAGQAKREARSSGRREGTVTVDTTRPQREKRINRGVGEYVEFEEITIEEKNKAK